LPYLFLLIAILTEILGTTLLKASSGFADISKFIGGVIFFMIALFFMTLSFKTIQLSIGYAVWAGTGTAGAAIIGLYIWGEKLYIINYLGMFLIILGVILINLHKTA